jgi:hypothetical protein
MRLISILEISDKAYDEKVYKTSLVSDLIAFTIFFLLLLASCVHYVWFLLKGEVNGFWYIGYVLFGGTFLLFTWIAWSRIKAGRLPSNWLVRSNTDRALIKFRSFQNYHYPKTDDVIIELPWREVRWVRKTKETLNKPGADGTVTQFFTYLDLKLNLSDHELQEIESALAKERNIKPLRSDLDKLRHELFRARKDKLPKHEIEEIKQRIKVEKMTKREKGKSGVKHHDYPVSLVQNNIMRIRWNGIRPNIKKILASLSDFLQIEEEVKIKSDSSVKLQGKELDDMILDRIAKGEMMDARNLVRVHYGYSMTEAKHFIDELMNESSV